MTTYEEMKENYSLIEMIVRDYRKELTVVGGVLGEQCGLVDCDEYIEFMNTLPPEVFLGNYLTGILNKPCCGMYRDVISGKMKFKDMIARGYGRDFWKEVEGKL